MAFGFFGAFILGFLGTAMPRMLTAKPLRGFEVISLLLLHGCMATAFAFERIQWGDLFLCLWILLFVCFMVPRFRERKDTPPPGFVLVFLAFASALAGAVMAVVLSFQEEPDAFWVTLQKLLGYQGFVLLPILGIGPFILPRLFAMESSHNFPESLAPSKAWRGKAFMALFAGVAIVASFVVEAFGNLRVAHGLRFAITLAFLWVELPLQRAPQSASTLGAAIRLAFVSVLAGFLAVSIWPGYRTALLHFTLVGGFAVVTVVVATRVVFGHSGRLKQLQGRNIWLLAALGLMLLGMATRISADFLPKVRISHYIYGSAAWIIGLLLWSAFVLPRVLFTEPED